jgi:hypothetical protein
MIRMRRELLHRRPRMKSRLITFELALNFNFLFHINYYLVLYLPIVPKRLGLSCGLHIREPTRVGVKSRYKIVSWQLISRGHR